MVCNLEGLVAGIGYDPTGEPGIDNSPVCLRHNGQSTLELLEHVLVCSRDNAGI
jgi:hypothetical protein